GARRRVPASRGAPTTAARSDGAGAGSTAEARRRHHRGQASQLLLLQGEGRRDRLQEHQPAPPLHLREGEDPQPADHRRVPAASGPDRAGGEARERDGAPALRRRRPRRAERRAPRPRRQGPRPLMNVILLEDLDKIGLRGDVVSVARGYARNFLFPRRLAEAATGARVAELRRRDSERARHQAKTAEQAQSIADTLAKTVLRFEVKAGPTGSLFGSVTPTDIADEIWRTRKIRIDRRKIDIDNLKRIGRYDVPIDVFEGVRVEVKTTVVPEGGELPSDEELDAMAAAEAADQQ